MNTSMNRIYVANLPPDIRIKDIDDFFRPFGRVVNIDVNNRSNPVYAYVQFDTARNAYNAVRARHGYDYEGYTLQMRLVESEVIKRREFTPPPPPPPIFNNERQNSGLNNFGTNYNRMPGNLSGSSFPVNLNSQWTNNNTSMAQQSHVLAQYTTSNRNNMPQQNMNFPTNIRQQDMRMRLDNGRSNVLDQFSNTNNQNMQQQFPNSNFSNMQQQYTNSNRSNMPQQNNNFPNHSDMLQQNTMPYSGNDRSSMQDQYNYNNNVQEQMGMMNNSNNSSWNSNINMNRNFGNQGMDQNIYNNARRNESYNSNDNFDMYTNGVSGPSRNSHNQYMQKGSKPENARTNALEHRNAPYHREATKNKPVPVDNANAALETIGNTIMSLLSTNQLDNFQQGNRNFGRSGPSTSLSQTPCSAISKGGHFESVKQDSDRSAENSKTTESDKPSISGEAMVWDKFIKKKEELLVVAAGLNEGKKRRKGKEYKRRMNLLLNEGGLSELEAKPLAILPPNKLNEIISLKKEYDNTRNTNFVQNDKADLTEPQSVASYLNDIRFMETHQIQRVSKLSKPVLQSLNECAIRINNYEKDNKLPPTRSKFIRLVRKYVSVKKMQPNEKKTLDQATANGKPEMKTKSNPNRKNSKGNQQLREENNIAENVIHLEKVKNESFGKSSDQRSTALNSASPEVQLWDKISKQKDDLLIEATTLYKGKRRRKGGAYKNRAKRLMNEGCITEREANLLAILHIDRLNNLIALVKEYINMTTKPTTVSGDGKNLNAEERIANYLKDIKYISLHEKQRLSKLSKNVIDELSACVTRIHHYEKNYKVPPIRNKFIKTLRKIAFAPNKQNEKKALNTESDK